MPARPRSVRPARPLRLSATLALAAALGEAALMGLTATAASSQTAPRATTPDAGYAIDHQVTIQRCASCHTRDAEGRLSRISWMRKTPEGWQTSIRRMVSLNGVELSPEEARAIVKYLSDRQGLAPEELEPARWEVERRLIDFDYEADDDTEATCIDCHSMGRVMTQRRTKEEWGLLLETHRGLYPLVDGQSFRENPSDDEDEPGEDGRPPDNRQPMDKAIDHLSRAFPLTTPEWAAWSATMRSPRLEGTWLISGYEPGKGRLYGTMTVLPDNTADDTFTYQTRWTYAETGEEAVTRGQAVVYTGHQWRGRSSNGGDLELREVLSVSRDWRTMDGRWFAGAYDEIGPDVTLTRVSALSALAGVHPRALQTGATGVEVTVYGSNLPGDLTPADFDFGPGVTVTAVDDATPERVTLRVSVAAGAAKGARDLFVQGIPLTDAAAVHDGIDRIEVTPEWNMARVGGVVFPVQLAVFDAVGFDDGADGRAGTADDIELGRVPATWAMEEYSAVFGDDDTRYVGSIGRDGTFTPAQDGPNPERTGNRNNVGDVWVVATHERAGSDPLRARAHLLVTVPLYARFDPWQAIARPPYATQNGGGGR